LTTVHAPSGGKVFIAAAAFAFQFFQVRHLFFVDGHLNST